MFVGLAVFLSCYGRDGRRDARAALAVGQTKETCSAPGDQQSYYDKTAALFNVQIEMPANTTTTKTTTTKKTHGCEGGSRNTTSMKTNGLSRDVARRISDEARCKTVADRIGGTPRREKNGHENVDTKQETVDAQNNSFASSAQGARKLAPRGRTYLSAATRKPCTSSTGSGTKSDGGRSPSNNDELVVSVQSGFVRRHSYTADRKRTVDDAATSSTAEHTPTHRRTSSTRSRQPRDARRENCASRDEPVLSGKPPTRKRGGDSPSVDARAPRDGSDESTVGTVLRTDDGLKKIVDSYARQAKHLARTKGHSSRRTSHRHRRDISEL